MSKEVEQHERHERAKRLVQARKNAGFTSAKKASDRFNWKVDTYKAHESGRNGFGVAYAKAYAKAFNVSLAWLNFNQGQPTDDFEDDRPPMVEVPMISWISAGPLGEQPAVEEYSEFPVVITDLAEGDWIALRVEGPSMNKISPPDSVIFVNRRERTLVPNACYVIADETGKATYKRYRPNETPPFRPASYENIEAPQLDGAITIVGRVRRSRIDM